MISKQVNKTIKTAKLIILAEELLKNKKDISIFEIKNIAKTKNIDISNIKYPNLVKILKENNYDFKKTFDKSKFAQRRIEMAELTRKGWTLQMIGDKYGITRQAVSLLLKKAASQDEQIVVKSKNKRNDLNEKNVIFVKRSKKQHKNCTICGKGFFSNAKRKTCSKECLRKSIDLRTGGEWSRCEKVNLICSCCGEPFQRTKYLQKIVTISKGNSDNNYCSRTCYHNRNKTVSPVQGVVFS